MNIGIIYGILISLGTIVLETLIPTLLNYSIAPKVSLKIDNIQLEKKTFKNIEGYLLTALVTNKGKKIASTRDNFPKRSSFNISTDLNIQYIFCQR